MAKRPSRSKKKAAANEQSAESPLTTAIKAMPMPDNFISETTLKKLLNKDRGYEKDIASIVGEKREALGYAKDNHNLNTKAYGLMKQFHKMEAERAAEVYYAFHHLMLMAGVIAKIESVIPLPLDETVSPATGDGGEADEETSDADDEPENVSRPQFGGRQLETW